MYKWTGNPLVYEDCNIDILYRANEGLVPATHLSTRIAAAKYS